jgi:hypothetical protein
MSRKDDIERYIESLKGEQYIDGVPTYHAGSKAETPFFENESPVGRYASLFGVDVIVPYDPAEAEAARQSATLRNDAKEREVCDRAFIAAENDRANQIMEHNKHGNGNGFAEACNDYQAAPRTTRRRNRVVYPVIPILIVTVIGLMVLFMIVSLVIAAGTLL